MNLDGALTTDWQQRLSLGTSREDIDTPAFASALRSTREQMSWTNDVTLSTTQHLVAGVDYMHDRGVSIDYSGFGAPYDVARDNGGAFAGWRVQDGVVRQRTGRALRPLQPLRRRVLRVRRGRLENQRRGPAPDASYGTAFRAPNSQRIVSRRATAATTRAIRNWIRNVRARPRLGLDWRLNDANRLASTRLLDARARLDRFHRRQHVPGDQRGPCRDRRRRVHPRLELPASGPLENNLTLQNPRDTGYW